ncbi:MAG: zinc ribbon domain-containing protein [Firmicutes bacterium]|nr:zinc ribbon domain-containing protein [Bacillota bacterium]
MPIIEYKCQACGKTFERILPSSVKDSEVICPHCGRADCKRRLSIFSTGNASPAAQPAARKFT